MIGEAISYGENSFVTGNKQENISLKGFTDETWKKVFDIVGYFCSHSRNFRRYYSGGGSS
jgi:hypothetical protein